MQSSRITARGFEFEALTDGPENGDLVILLHGLPRNCWEWHHQIPAIAALGFRVVAPDLRGFCASARPIEIADYHVQEYVEDLYAHYYSILTEALIREGGSAPKAEALALMSLLEGTTIFLGKGRRWANQTKAVRKTILEFIEHRYGSS